MDQWINTTQAAKQFDTNRMRIWRAVRSGDIKNKLENNQRLIYVPDLITEINRPRKKPERNYPWSDPEEIFWSNIEKTETCWLWRNGNSDGYGHFSANGEQYIAHRFSYELHFGEIRDGLFVCHRCDNPPCVNPNHLFLGTPKQNSRDAMRKGRLAKGVKIGISKLTPKAVREIRSKYIPRKYSANRLAKEYGVSIGTIWAVLRMKTWRHIK